jgi:ABC-type cobalamin/Fe3+-siderophores transport system ATPase subunit
VEGPAHPYEVRSHLEGWRARRLSAGPAASPAPDLHIGDNHRAVSTTVSESLSGPSAVAAELAAVVSETPGARYLRTDLQVHTPLDPGFKPRPEPTDPADRRELARAYLGEAKERGIQLVGITEHNDVSWIDELRYAAQGMDLLLLPGFEVESKEGIHVLCLFDPDTPVTHLEESLVRLGLTQKRRSAQRLELRTEQDFGGLINLVQDERGGVCIAAHIESDKGLLSALRQGARVDCWRTEGLMAAQIAKPPSEITSGNGRIIRGEDPIYERKRPLAYVLTSDARSLQDIGSVSTWIKMDQIGVHGLRQAFLDPDSRISFEDPVARRRGSHLLGVSWEGGFLDGIRFPLNPELNCLIGGKGTGKSTVIESIRFAFDLDFRTDEVRAAATQLRESVLRSGAKVSVFVETSPPNPTRYVIERTAPHAPVVRDELGNAHPELDPQRLLAPRVYGQKEIYGIAQEDQARLDLLDNFATTALRDALERERELLQRCKENGQLILDTVRRLDDAETKLGELPNLEEWRKRFREAGFEELLSERRQLDREERLLTSAFDALRERRRIVADLRSDTVDLTSSLVAADYEGLPNEELLTKARSHLEAAETAWRSALAALDGTLTDAAGELDAVRSEWSDRRASRTVEFDRALRELQERMPDVDPERYLDVERRIEQLTPLRAARKQLHARLNEARHARAGLLIELVDARGEKHRVRDRAAQQLNEASGGAVRVELAFQDDRQAFLADLRALKTGARNESLERMVLDPTFTPSEFGRLLRDHQLSGQWSLPDGQAALLERSISEEDLLRLEVVELPDRVSLALDVGPEGTRDYRPLEKLSPGQKSTAILLLIMQASHDPLLIDQPEDDLDNRFIYDDIVQRLRAAKPARQFLIATHNANIPILGDAEQIIVLDAEERGGPPVRGVLRARGSIDAVDVRDAAEHILEGGREAFALRQEKYRV